MAWRDIFGCDRTLFERGGKLTDIGTLATVTIGPLSCGCINYPEVRVDFMKSVRDHVLTKTRCDRAVAYRLPVDVTVIMYRKQRGKYKLLRTVELISDLTGPELIVLPEFSEFIADPLLFDTCLDILVVDRQIDEWLEKVLSTPYGEPFVAV